MPTDLPNNWPHSDFTNVNLPLYLDIGCGKVVEDEQEYALANPLGIPTEREVSVLNNDLPIYRTLFIRNDVSFPSKSSLLARNL